MDFHVMAKSYDSYGAHPSLYRIGDFLLQGAPDFGNAIREISVQLCFPSSGPARKTLESTLEAHNLYRSTLPKVVFRRARRQVDIQVASDLMEGREWQPSRPVVSLSLFTRGIAEVIGALPLLRKRLKASDSFDLLALIAHCEAATRRIPANDEGLQALFADLDQATKARLDAKSPWEKLDIDWSGFHVRARELLGDPFFWDAADDFSPHGNDTGADLLESYRHWLERHPSSPPAAFLEDLAVRWGYDAFGAIDDDARHEASVGLAFADIKLRGTCDPVAAGMALESIAWQRSQARHRIDWCHREERLRALEKLENKLRQVIAGA